jgi:hypothetical protein
MKPVEDMTIEDVTALMTRHKLGTDAAAEIDVPYWRLRAHIKSLGASLRTIRVGTDISRDGIAAAVEKYGSYRAAARALKMSPSTIRGKLGVRTLDISASEGEVEATTHAEAISAYWERQGHAVKAWARQEFDGPSHSMVWVVKSDMINGLPRGYGKAMLHASE